MKIRDEHEKKYENCASISNIKYQILNEIFYHVKMDFYHFLDTCEFTCAPLLASGYLFKGKKKRFNVEWVSVDKHLNNECKFVRGMTP